MPYVPRARIGVFTAAEAYAGGWTPEALEHAVRTGRLLRLRRGVYVEAGLDQDRHPADGARRDRARRSIAAALVTTGSTVTGLAAATLLGFRVWAPRERACLNVVGGQSPDISGVHVHRSGMLDAAWADVAGFRITRPSRTVVEVAREFGTEAGLVVADSAVAAGATTAARLGVEVDRYIGRRGVGRARPLSGLVDGRSESVLESRSRWQFVVHALPAPEPQMWIHDLNGRFLGRTDFYWAAGVVGEVDGAGKLLEAADRKALLERQLGLARAGLRIVRWGATDLAQFAPTASWIRDELAAASADPRSARWIASPRRLGSETALWTPDNTVSDPRRR